MSRAEKLRPARDIIREVETFREARELLELLSRRDIGAICIKGVAVGGNKKYWNPNSELRVFAEEATMATSGFLLGDTRLELRRQPRQKVDEKFGKVTIFRGDTSLHFDGDYEEVFDDSGELTDVITRHPLLGRELYDGVSHHITTRGSTTFVMERLSGWRVSTLALNQQRANLGVVDTNPLNMAVQGEAIDLVAGDYMALHSYAVYRQPVYAHGTTNSSPNRNSIVYNPASKMGDLVIDSLLESHVLEPTGLRVESIDDLPVRIIQPVA